jgi:hypothetical protein
MQCPDQPQLIGHDFIYLFEYTIDNINLCLYCIDDNVRKKLIKVRLLTKRWSKSTKLATIPSALGEFCSPLPPIQEVCAVAEDTGVIPLLNLSENLVSCEQFGSCNQ